MRKFYSVVIRDYVNSQVAYLGTTVCANEMPDDVVQRKGEYSKVIHWYASEEAAKAKVDKEGGRRSNMMGDDVYCRYKRF